jgi:hypothetical protein
MAPNLSMLQALARQKAAQKTPTGLKSIAKPKDIQDIYDEQLATASQNQYPSAWRPQSLTGPEIDTYAAFILGPKYPTIKNNIIRTAAPTYFAAAKSTNAYEKTLAQLVAAGASPQEIKTVIVEDYNKGNPDILAFPVTSTSGDLLSAASAYADDLFKEYNTKVEPAIKDYLSASDKSFKANLPHPNLKYGKRTNLSKGIIGVDTINDSTKNYIDTKMKEFSDMRKNLPGFAPSGYLDPTEHVASVVNKKGQTPFKDEAIRRQSLKGKNIKP